MWGFDCSFGFWVGDGRSGTQFSGGGRPAWFSPVFLLWHGRQAREPRQRASLPPVFQFGWTHSEGWVARFLAAVAGLMGVSEGNDGGDFSKGRNSPRVLARRMRGAYRQGSIVRSVPFSVVDLPSPGWLGKGHGARVRGGVTSPTSRGLHPRAGLAGFPGFLVPPFITAY